MRIENSVIWVCGGSKGIGEATAKLLVEKGAKVFITARGEADLVRVAGLLGENCAYKVCDITDIAQIKETAAAIVEKWGRIDALVHTAAIQKYDKLFDEDGELVEDDVFNELIRVNVIGSYDVARVAAYYMKNNEPSGDFGERGCIILSGSLNALSGSAKSGKGERLIGYKASKTAIQGLTVSLATNLGEFGIRVNRLLPGITLTPMTKDDFYPGMHIPSLSFPKCPAEPQYCAKAVIHMLENEYLNKAEIVVDGGSTGRF